MKRIELSKQQRNIANQLLKRYKDYEAFSRNKEDAYNFTNIIGIKVCPYCNIEYVYTVYNVKGQPVVRPDIDHFIPKNAKTGNPKLELRLTNLIPSCLICNERLKKTIPFSKSTNIHPYFDDFDNIIRFGVSLNDTNYLDEKSFDVVLQTRDSASAKEMSKAFTNAFVFKLYERYQFHKDEVVMLFKRMKSYNTAKVIEIENLLNETDETASNLTFLFPEKYCDINNTSLGKLKKDVIKKYL